MKIIASIAVFCLSLTTASAQRTAERPSGGEVNGRYQLFAAESVASTAGEKTVFLLDTETGVVWKLQAASSWTDVDGKQHVRPASWIKMTFLEAGEAPPTH